jgi:hypothetical protein
VPDPTLPTREAAAVRPQLEASGLFRVAPPSADCNCHGWLFLAGHYWLQPLEVNLILEDNGYREVRTAQVGDLVLYRGDWGIPEHSGVVLAVTEGTAVVESKWGDLGCYLHPPELPQYGRPQFYRSDRPGHLVCGVVPREPSASAAQP